MTKTFDKSVNGKKLYNGIHLQPNPEISASWMSHMFFRFLNPLMEKGNKKRLEAEDMFEPLPDLESKSVTENLSNLWEKEQKSARAEGRASSLLRAIFYFNTNILYLGLYIFMEEILIMLQPVFMGRLIRHFRFGSSPGHEDDALLSAAHVAMLAIGIVAFHHPYMYAMQKLALRTRVATTGMIAQKSLRLSSTGLSKVSIGHVVNLITTDVQKFHSASVYINYLWIAPLLFCFNVYFIWNEIGVASLAGFAGLLVLSPVQAYFSKKTGSARRKIAEKTDKRISFINEVLNGIRLIKMFSWEDAFVKRVGELRRDEIVMYRWSAAYKSVVRGIFWPCGKFLLLLTASSYIYLGHDLSAEKIFVASALLNAFRMPLMLYFPFSVEGLCELRVTCRRIEAFLLLEEYDAQGLEDLESSADTSMKTGSEGTVLTNGKTGKTRTLTDRDLPENRTQPRVVLENLTTSWKPENNDAKSRAIRNFLLSARPGQLIGIVGPVGSGKSSLLASILRETRRVDGSLTVKGTIAYCSQEAWIFGGTIRENILFGRQMDNALYFKAVELSSLLADLDHIPFGDEAVVGDRGTSLSGGQRARVALARAIYSDPDIYLLDDPLSAVDAKVGREIFRNCISKHLRNRIVILVTHQLQFLTQVDQVFLMNGGEIVKNGSPKELLESDEEIVAQVFQGISDHSHTSVHEQPTESETKDNSETNGYSKLQSMKGKRVPVEERASGSVSGRTYWKYLTAMCSNRIVLALTIFIVFAVQIQLNLVDYWLTKWTSAAESATRLRDNHTITSTDEYVDRIPLFFNSIEVHLSLLNYQTAFTGLTILLIVVSIVRCVWVRMAQTIASEVQNKELFQAVISSGIDFFDTNPLGRILSRFSKDVNTVDNQLASVVFDLMINALSSIGVVVMIVYINPYILITVTPLVLLVISLRDYYNPAATDVRRMEALARSPLYTHVSTVLHGLTTLRAFGNTENAMKAFHEKMNVSASASMARMSTNRWFSVQVDWMAAIFVAIVGFVAVLSPKMFSSGEVALMLVYAVELSSTFAWVVRMFSELQNHMVSMERLVEYSELPSEFENDSTQEQPPVNWPSEASIQFDRLCLKYDPAGDLILNELSLTIKSKEKIGIVGRTGAGKSSLLRALFRLTPACSGRILIDGIDISTIPLKTLRRSLAIIPQEPVLFVGTVRYNLDPLNEYSNKEIWDALEAVELRETIGVFGLEAEMREGGSNLSVGQRQLVCLARAILRKAKILVIDEATANVDQYTDRQIQSTIRRRFKESTVLTIAHRLNTIMDSDRILVLNNGKVEEFDTPKRLLEQKNSFLNKLMGTK